jgi:hypothetical protein
MRQEKHFLGREEQKRQEEGDAFEKSVEKIRFMNEE